MNQEIFFDSHMTNHCPPNADLNGKSGKRGREERNEFFISRFILVKVVNYPLDVAKYLLLELQNV